MDRVPLPLRLAVDGAERLVNRILALDAECVAALSGLDGRVLALAPAGFGWALLVRPGSRGFAFQASTASAVDLEAEVDVVISGPPFSLLAAMTAGGADGAFPEEVRIAGEMAIAQRLQRALGNLDVDWEEQLARVLGDVAAHEVARVARGAAAWGRESAGRAVEQVGEYLAAETGVAVGVAELEEFAGAIEDLRDDAERLAARVARIEVGNA